ncbi:MAG: hypothetical protein ACR2OX_12145, partial [Methyloligellaceae bacterium]
MKSFFLKLLTVASALALSFLLIEVGLRLFVPVTDHPYTEYEPDLGVHLTPMQEGKVTLGVFGDFQAAYRVNNAGWNSIHDYQAEKPNGTLRIAVIGDSFVEALGVDVDKGFQVQMERRLNQLDSCPGYDNVEIYSFGYSGIPMSQYVSIMRHVQQAYSPDAYIVNIFPLNDFEASLKNEDDTGDSHILTYRPNDQGGFVEVPPVPYTPSRLKRFVSNFAIVRYVLLNLNVKSHPVVRQIMAQPSFYGNRSVKDDDLLSRFTTFVFGEYKEIADERPLLIVADANRNGIYTEHGLSPGDFEGVYPVDPRYYDFIERAVTTSDISYLPLHPVLADDFAKNRKRFEFVSNGRTLDSHWNAHANELIGAALAAWAQSNVCGVEQQQ